jgi:hypothetical protein
MWRRAETLVTFLPEIGVAELSSAAILGGLDH